VKVAVVLVALAACSDPDPCAGLGACVRLHVQSSKVTRIDTLELDVVYGAKHATTSTQAGGGEDVDLPLVTGVEVATTAPVRVGIVAAGKRGGNVLGTGAGVAMLDPGAHADLTIDLAPVASCTAGAFYCGGDKLAGDPGTLYECNAGGVPLARGVCPAGCTVRPANDDVCAASGGTCRDGGKYCGGDKLAGDPQTVYVCAAGAGTQPMACTNGCVVAAAGSDDYCR
jgi:hypothetical protein